MGKTTKYAIPYPEPEDLADIPKDAKTTVEKIEETIQTIDTATQEVLENIEENPIVYEINTDSNYYYITDSKILVASEVL